MKTLGLDCDACGEDCGYVPPYTETQVVVRVSARRDGAPVAQFADVDPLSRLIMRGFPREVDVGGGRIEQRVYNQLDLCARCAAKFLTAEGREELLVVLTPKALPDPRRGLKDGVLNPDGASPPS